MTRDIKLTVVSPPEFYRAASAVMTMGTTSANAASANTTDTPLKNWKAILAAGKKVSAAYADLVAASDALAAMLPYHREYVLRRVLPRTPNDRRNSRRILEWLITDRGSIQADMKRHP